MININIGVILMAILERRRKERTQMPTLIDVATEIIQNPPFYNLKYVCFQLESTKTCIQR